MTGFEPVCSCFTFDTCMIVIIIILIVCDFIYAIKLVKYLPTNLSTLHSPLLRLYFLYASGMFYVVEHAAWCENLIDDVYYYCYAIRLGNTCQVVISFICKICTIMMIIYWYMCMYHIYRENICVQ